MKPDETALAIFSKGDVTKSGGSNSSSYLLCTALMCQIMRLLAAQ